MSDNRDDAELTPDEGTFDFYCRVDQTEDSVTADCAACGGTGAVALLTTTRPCEKCGGTGKAGQYPPGEPFDEWGEPVPGYWVTETAFDNGHRAIREQQWFVPESPRLTAETQSAQRKTQTGKEM